MKVTNNDKQIWHMEFYLCIYTRLRKQILKSPILYQAFVDGVSRALAEADCSLIDVIRGAENKKGTVKYANAFLTLHIRTDRYSPEDIFDLVCDSGWRAICEADTEHHYRPNLNGFTTDYLILGANDYDTETIYEYAFTRDTRTRKDDDEDNTGGLIPDDDNRMYVV